MLDENYLENQCVVFTEQQSKEIYFNNFNKEERHKVWSKRQKETLKELYRKYKTDWQKISNEMPGRTAHACHSMINALKKKKNKKKGQLYTKQQDELLLKLYKIYPEQWDQISNKFPNKRTPQALYCKYRYLQNFNYSEPLRDWTQEEDKLLLQVVSVIQYEWELIAKVFPNCTPTNCYQRYKRLIDQRGVWKFEEDSKLLEFYDKHGPNWEKISLEFGNTRSWSGIYYRYYMLKNQNLKKQWIQKNLQQLIKQYKIQNGNWTQIQKKFPNYTMRQCYFTYHEYIRKKLAQSQNYRKRRRNTQFRKRQYINFWTFAEDELLLKLAQEKQKDWKKISQQFQKRKSHACQTRYQTLQKILKNDNNRKWTQQQDWKLILYTQSTRFNLNIICGDLKNCTKEDCYLRYRELMQRDPKLKSEIYASEKKRRQLYNKKYEQVNAEVSEQQIYEEQ